MGLSVDQITILSLTRRKADCEYNISIDAMEKMALTRDQSRLTSEYYARLQGKNISYYADGKYNNMTYEYLMGYGVGTNFALWQNPSTIKNDNSMILTDASGLVVLGSQYVSTMTTVLGSNCINSKGRGGTFSEDKIPALIASIAGAPLTEQNVKEVIDGGKVDYGYNFRSENTLSKETTKTDQYSDSSSTYTDKIEQLVNFFYPIFKAASANGWTTEYNDSMKSNKNYISDALVSGTFQLVQTNKEGGYDPDTSLSYFVLSGLVYDKTDASAREEVTAWYNAEKEKLNEEETWLDLDMQNLSTEEESINTEIESIKSRLEDDMKPFSLWT